MGSYRPVEDGPLVKNRVLAGVLCMVCAMTIVPFMDAISKHLAATLPVIEIVWARYFFHFLFFAPFALLRYGKRALWPRHIVFQIIRGGFLLGSTLFFFTALASIPLADALALYFIAPLIVTALAPLVLGEQVGIRLAVSPHHL